MAGKSKYKRWPSLWYYDALGIHYVVHDGHYRGPVWTGHCMMLDASESYGDGAFFHELLHWLCASGRQRSFPDFALGRQVNAHSKIFATSSTLAVYTEKDADPPSMGDRNGGWGEKTVLRTTAANQESWACWGMWYYEPLMEIWGWDEEPNFDKIASATYDFAGDYMHQDYFPSRMAEGIWSHFKALFLMSSVKFHEVDTYTDALQSGLTEWRKANR